MEKKVQHVNLDLVKTLLSDPEIQAANQQAFELLSTSNPILIDVKPAIEVVPGMTRQTVLTSGPPLPWEQYQGGQRQGIIGGVLYEGLARSPEEADEAIRRGKIRVAPCQDFGCIGSLAGIYTASMPVLVVKDPESGNEAYCSLFEGKAPARLNYGVYNDQVKENLTFLEQVIGPLLGEAIRTHGGIELGPIMRRALHMGDELHSRNTAATLLFTRELFPTLLTFIEKREKEKLDLLLDYLLGADYFFLRLSMAAAKVTVDRISNIPRSTLVSTMTFSCREFAIRVAGLGDQWFRGPLPQLRHFHLFEGHTPEEIEFMGGESIVIETAGLGGFAQAAAFPLQLYQGGTPERMVETNLEMYSITTGEHPHYKIPYFGYRGTPVGIDLLKVLYTGITPAMDIGVAGRGGGQIGAGSARAPLEPFEKAFVSYLKTYGIES
jgi:hypothetical protein